MKRFIHRPLAVLTHHLNSWQKLMHDRSILEMARNRTLVVSGVFLLAFFVICIRLFDVMVLHSNKRESTEIEDINLVSHLTSNRADIIDRNGEVIATHLVTGSVYANPKVIINPEEAALKLSKLFPDLSYESLLKKLKSDKGFTWIIRHIPPRMQFEVNNLGIPGVYIQRDEKRVYPHGPLVSHVIGYCGIDNDGLGGVEQYFNARLRKDDTPLQLSIDIRVQHIVHEELKKGIEEFRADGGNGLVMDAETGELLAMVSMPDYDPNLPNQNSVEATFNRNTLGIYECGSTFKIFNTAIALESGKARLTSLYDASAPIHVGSHQITDYKGKNRILDVREVFVYSSNIGSAKMAMDFGREVQRQYLGRLGLLTSPKLEIPEIGSPMVPKYWNDATTMTVAFGYGIAVSPIMITDAVRGVIKGHKRYAMTLLKRTDTSSLEGDNNFRVITEKTSAQIRELMHLVVTEGTAKKANVQGYAVIGKTGSAHKNNGRRGYNDAKITSFIGAFPKDDPKYIVVIFLDSPKPTAETAGYSTAGWNSAPIAGRVISRMAPLLGVQPESNDDINGSVNRLIPVSLVEEEIHED